MNIVIISGRSGSGKTIALRALEDLGYYCIDNLPISLLPQLESEIGKKYKKVAISIDSRNIPKKSTELEKIIKSLKSNPSCSLEILYLDAKDNVIIKRFSETRRKHPLTNNNLTLLEAITKEKLLLQPLINSANEIIDTSSISNHELHSFLEKKFKEDKKELQVLIQSFGFKHGLPPDADFVFDVRCLPNPFWEQKLKDLTGKEQEVIEYLNSKDSVKNMINDITSFLKKIIPKFFENNRSYINIAIGCTGGKHRSVFIAEFIAKELESLNLPSSIIKRHREI